MGTILASAVIEKAQIVLMDATGTRWPVSTELLRWLCDGQREVLVYKPNAFVKNLAVKLDAGTRQSIPADGVQLIDVVRNMGVEGTTPGRAVRITERESLDASTPDWHASTASATVKHYTYSLLDPKHFYVFPPQPAADQGFVDVIYGAIPGDVLLAAPIAVDDIYQNVLVDYILYRAFSKESEYSADGGRAASHQNAYLSALTGKMRVEWVTNPNASAPANPDKSQRAG